MTKEVSKMRKTDKNTIVNITIVNGDNNNVHSNDKQSSLSIVLAVVKCITLILIAVSVLAVLLFRPELLAEYVRLLNGISKVISG